MTMIQPGANGTHHVTDSLGNGLAFREIRAFICDGRGGFVSEDRAGESTASDESALSEED